MEREYRILYFSSMLDTAFHVGEFLHRHLKTARADPEGGLGVRTPPLENHKNIWFLSETGPDRLKNHKVTKSAFNVGIPSARQRNDI